MFKKILFAGFCFFFLNVSFSQVNKEIQRPKLVVGLVIDQMRWDFLYRYYDLYGDGGFKRLLNQGFSCENTFIPYVPTYTAPGHTCIYTGSVPAIHGIIGNNWFDKNINKTIYCTDDTSVISIGSTSAGGKMSPSRLLVTTIGDELRLSNNFKSKVIGVSLKDRAAILPAGHTANAAYWFDTGNGKWITSSYYMKELPAWMNRFNDRHLPDSYMSKDWTTLLPAAKYNQSTEDDKNYERSIPGEKTTTFPHLLSKITTSKYDAFEYTPFATTYTFDLAKAVIENESMGSNSTDFLAVSISPTDYVGHSFGPNSMEIEDIYLRLDNDIADFLKYLDNRIGKQKYILFLSADHGVAHIPAFLKEHNTPSGVFTDSSISRELSQMIEREFGLKNVVQLVLNYQVYLNTEKIEKEGKQPAAVKSAVIKLLKQKPFVVDAFETEKTSEAAVPATIKQMIINGYNPKRSGEIEFIIQPEYFDWTARGTTHGSWNPYDAHIPLVWFGWNVNPGKTNRQVYMTDISATLAALLHIQMPNGCVGKVITELHGSAF